MNIKYRDLTNHFYWLNISLAKYREKEIFLCLSHTKYHILYHIILICSIIFLPIFFIVEWFVLIGIFVEKYNWTSRLNSTIRWYFLTDLENSIDLRTFFCTFYANWLDGRNEILNKSYCSCIISLNSSNAILYVRLTCSHVEFYVLAVKNLK